MGRALSQRRWRVNWESGAGALLVESCAGSLTRRRPIPGTPNPPEPWLFFSSFLTVGVVITAHGELARTSLVSCSLHSAARLVFHASSGGIAAAKAITGTTRNRNCQ